MASSLNDYKRRYSKSLIDDPIAETAGLTSSLQIVDTTVGLDLWPLEGTSANDDYSYLPEPTQMKEIHITEINFDSALKFAVTKNKEILEKLAEL